MDTKATCLKITTARLELVAETAELARAEIACDRQLSEALDAQVPEDWPLEDIEDALTMFAAKLRKDPGLAGWMSWYWIKAEHADSRTLIGCGGFTARPVDGVVAIGYSLLPAYRGKGYATEAVRGLVAWAFTHPEVREVIAETLPENAASVNVLVRAGFHRAGKPSEPGHLRFVIEKP